MKASKRFFVRFGAPVLAAALVTPAVSHAAVLADWTFESTIPATSGPFSPEIGAGAASGNHAGGSTYSSPSGNGSAHSFSSNTWAVGDYYQFTTSATGSSNILLKYDQTSSNTGPGGFQLAYSTDGANFTNFGPAYTVIPNATLGSNTFWSAGSNQPAFTFNYDLSSITALNNAANIYFRLIDSSTTAANGGSIGSGGTDRVDNVIISGSAVPEPTSAAILGVVGLGIVNRRRRTIGR